RKLKRKEPDLDPCGARLMACDEGVRPLQRASQKPCLRLAASCRYPLFKGANVMKPNKFLRLGGSLGCALLASVAPRLRFSTIDQTFSRRRWARFAASPLLPPPELAAYPILKAASPGRHRALNFGYYPGSLCGLP